MSSLRRLIDEVQDDPPLLILEYLDSNLLVESGKRKLESSDIKCVARVVLQALAALHDEGVVHTGAWKAIKLTSYDAAIDLRFQMSNPTIFCSTMVKMETAGAISN